MRWLWLPGCLLLAGCAQTQLSGPDTAAQPLAGTGGPTQTNQTGLIVTPARVIHGKVARVNTKARHAILTFPLGQVPPLDSRFNVYRAGLKVGEVHITGPRLDVHIAADIVAGECQVGDEVRDN